TETGTHARGREELMAKRSAPALHSDLAADIDEDLPPQKTRIERVLDVVERVGNRVPHPVIIFLMLIGFIIVLSHIVYLFGAGVTYETIDPETGSLVDVTINARSLLTGDGLRFMYGGVVDNFMSFTATG